MKKRYLVFAVILMLTCCASCAKNTLPVVEEYTFYDFEDYGRNFMQLRMFDDFGIVEQNFDAEYVAQGKASAKLNVMGNPNYTVQPYIVFPTYAPNYDYDYTDFSKVRCFTGQFYNAGEQEMNLEIGLAVEAAVINQRFEYQKLSTGEHFLLKPGWNSVVYVIEADFIDILYDSKSIYGVYLRFDNARAYSARDAQVVYVDDFRLQQKAAAHVPADPVVQDADYANGIFEVASFDKAYQKYAVWCRDNIYREAIPEIDVVSPGLGSDIGNVLSVLTRPGKIGGYGYGWPFVSISGKLFEKIDLPALKDTSEYRYYIAFDFYNATDQDVRIEVDYYDASETYRSWTYYAFTASPSCWTTYRYPLNDIEMITGHNIYGENIVTKYVDAPGSLAFIWSDCSYAETSNDRRLFYINDVRIEKGDRA